MNTSRFRVLVLSLTLLGALRSSNIVIAVPPMIVHLASEVRTATDIAFVDHGRLSLQCEKNETITTDEKAWFAFGGPRLGDRPNCLLLADETLLHGSLQQLDQQQVKWLSPLWGPLTIPRPYVVGIVSAPAPNFREWFQRIQELRSREGVLDSLLLRHHVWREGLLTAPSETPLWHEFSREIDWIPKGASTSQVVSLDQVFALRLASSNATPLSNAPTTCDLAFRNGDRLRCLTWKIIDQDRVQLDLSIPLSLTSQIPNAELAAQLCGANRRWEQQEANPCLHLATIEPASYRHLPRHRLPIPLQRTDGRDASPFEVHHVARFEGLKTPGASQVAYRHDGNASFFCTELACEDPASGDPLHLGKVRGRILVSRGGPLETVWTSEPMGPLDPSQMVRLEMNGVRLLVLVTEPLHAYQVAQPLLWLYPRITQKTAS